ncbi:hypothetical protein WJX72_002366 [[Myrmecia] bisecta]|uniref:Methyltransferase type 11 domain-containing protein n=1 Tax=[Myrmecia] bisecta TaxID=41462 RepID=A0AAW1PZW0_9CHLO
MQLSGSFLPLYRHLAPAFLPRSNASAPGTPKVGPGLWQRCRGRRLRVCAVSAAPAPTQLQVSQRTEVEFVFACPICQQTELKVQAQSRPQQLSCQRCARTFSGNKRYIDLTLTSGLQPGVYQQSFWGGVTIFQSPLVSFVYERGWRQGFAWAGFPGADEEFQMAMDCLRPAYGQPLLDMSCGSGLFSRRFVESGKFAGVIAADFSGNMLEQAGQFFDQQNLDKRQYTLLKADVGRLPFPTGSLAAVHAGAAIHCWPNPTAAVAEISRVLKPGGVFVASTFLNFTAPLGALVGDNVVRPLNRLEPSTTRAYKWWEEQELADLMAAVGLQKFRRVRRQRFILFSVVKPGQDRAVSPNNDHLRHAHWR